MFKVAALTAVVINIFDFLLASPATLKEYPELLSKGGSGVRAACFVGGLVIAAMPSTTLRWRLTLTAQLSLVKLIPAAILAYRMRDDGLIFAVYYADRMTFLLGFCGMLTITNYERPEQAVGRVGSARRGLEERAVTRSRESSSPDTAPGSRSMRLPFPLGRPTTPAPSLSRRRSPARASTVPRARPQTVARQPPHRKVLARRPVLTHGPAVVIGKSE